MYNREEYDALARDRKKESLNGEKQNLEYLVQAEVKMGNLTGNASWDFFLSILQSALERMQERDAQLTLELCSPGTVDPNKIMELKLALADITGQIKALVQVISLPKEVMESGEKARTSLGR